MLIGLSGQQPQLPAGRLFLVDLFPVDTEGLLFPQVCLQPVSQMFEQILLCLRPVAVNRDDHDAALVAKAFGAP